MSKTGKNRQNKSRYQSNLKGKNIKTKKKKINNKKLILLLGMMIVLVFGLNRAVLGVSTIVKNIDDKKEQSKEVLKEESDNQFDIEEESNKIDDKYIVVIDPGHGGNDPGNVGYSTKNKISEKDIFEKEITLAISKKVGSILSMQKDIQVVLTRSEDEYVSLEERAKKANEVKSDVFVSIHMNAESGGDSAYGIETFYDSKTTNKSKELATTIQETIGAYISVRDRGVKENVYQVLTQTQSPGALIECGFMSNQKEEQKLLDSQYQEKLAEGIAQGILTFLDDNIKQ